MLQLERLPQFFIHTGLQSFVSKVSAGNSQVGKGAVESQDIPNTLRAPAQDKQPINLGRFSQICEFF